MTSIPLTSDEISKLFDEHLDDLYGSINVCSIVYPASRVLKATSAMDYELLRDEYLFHLLTLGTLKELSDESYILVENDE